MRASGAPFAVVPDSIAFEQAMDANKHSETKASTSEDVEDLHARCSALLDEWRKSDSVDERTPTDIGAIIFEAQVLLVCEEIHRGNMTDRRIQRAVAEISQQKHHDILETVRLRLFNRRTYVGRLRNVETVFQQLIRGDMNRSVTRPAKLS